MLNVLIIGAGLSGATLARKFAEAGHKVNVIEKNNVVGGHVADDEIDGVHVSRYGPHIFHTNDDEVLSFLKNCDVKLKPIEHKVESLTKAGWLPWPINHTTINRAYNSSRGVDIWKEQMQYINTQQPKETFEDKALHSIGPRLFELMIEHYTEKQWGMPCRDVPAETFGRIRIVDSDNTNFFDDKVVALPVSGYTKMVEQILDHEKIRTVLSLDVKNAAYVRQLANNNGFDLIFSSAPPDSLVGTDMFGELAYRRVQFVKISGSTKSWPTAVVNFATPDVPFTRATDYARLWGKEGKDLVIYEIPGQGEKLYPIRTKKNIETAEKYIYYLKRRFDIISIGRLGAFEYIDMWQAIKSAFRTFEKYCPYKPYEESHITDL